MTNFSLTRSNATFLTTEMHRCGSTTTVLNL